MLFLSVIQRHKPYTSFPILTPLKISSILLCLPSVISYDTDKYKITAIKDMQRHITQIEKIKDIILSGCEKLNSYISFTEEISIYWFISNKYLIYHPNVRILYILLAKRLIINEKLKYELFSAIFDKNLCNQ